MIPENSISRRLATAFAVLAGALLLSVGWILVGERGAEWRHWRASFDAGPGAATRDERSAGIQQIWLPGLQRVDRCVSCHLGIDDPGLVDAAQPFRAHSGDWLGTHPSARFGCTACHGGQGRATTFAGAAHEPLPHWPEPLLSAASMEANCGACHRERQPPRAAWLAQGRRRIAESNCAGCHEIPGYATEDVRAPRLDGLGDKLQPGWLRRWLQDPPASLAASRMPDFRLSAREVDDLTAYLLAQPGPELQAPSVDWSRADPERGGTVFRTARCVTCHALEGRGGGVGPELTRIGSKATRDWLLAYLVDPFRYQPETLMPHFRFAPDDLRDLVAYLSTELVDFEAQAQDPAGTGQVAAGREVFVRRGCRGCHALADVPEQPRIGPSLASLGARGFDAEQLRRRGIAATLPDWVYTKLREPESLASDARMPSFGFAEDAAASISLAVTSVAGEPPPAAWIRTDPSVAPYAPQGEFGALVRRFRCLSCHTVRGFGGTLSTVPLDRIGSQLQREYLEAFLQNPIAVRVSVEARMPRLGITAAEARLLADQLGSSFRDDVLEAAVPSGPGAVAQGQRLYERLGCRSCHIVGSTGGYVGPDLSDAGNRLRAGWIAAWLVEPERWKPGSLEPDHGLTPEEAQALAAYVMSLTKPQQARP